MHCTKSQWSSFVSAFGVSDSAEGLKMLLINGMCYSRLLSKIYVNYWRILKSRSTRETSLRESIEILRNSRHDSHSFFKKLSRTSRELLQNTFISFVYRSLTAFSFEMVKVCLRNTAVPSHIWILLACQVETTQVSGFVFYILQERVYHEQILTVVSSLVILSSFSVHLNSQRQEIYFWFIFETLAGKNMQNVWVHSKIFLPVISCLQIL